MMNVISSCAGSYRLAPFQFNFPISAKANWIDANAGRGRDMLTVKSGGDAGGEKNTERRSFLSLEEAGLVEMSGLSSHERFLCRLTISSLNLLRMISEQEGYVIEELDAGRICDWFLKDKLKREQNLDSVLQWDDDSEFIS